MINNILRLFLCALLTAYVTCAVGGDVMEKEYIVKINGIEMTSGSAQNILLYIGDSSYGFAWARDAKDPNIEVPEVKEGMDAVIVATDIFGNNDFMTVVSELYQNCLDGKNVRKVGEDMPRFCSTLPDKNGKHDVHMCIDGNKIVNTLQIW